jgi:predicted RNase H-like HicB family nuclease
MRGEKKTRAKRVDPLRYLVMIRRTATGYSVDVPDLPGCIAAAKTVKTARRLIAEAITLHLDLMRQSHDTIPAPRKSIEFTVDDTSEEELCTWVEVERPEPALSPS